MNRIFSLLIFFVFLISNANAYVLSTNSSGQTLAWPGGAASPTFYARWKNANGLSYSDVFTAFTNALSRWKYAGSANVNFDYWQGSNSGTPSSYGYDSKNAVFFSSESSQKLGASTIGVTYVYSSNGAILETDVEFNDDDFDFTTNPSDSSRFNSNVFLENVATHEFGHAYGLSHSASLQSTMLYIEYRNQYRLSCDDIHGIAAIYPSSSFSSGRGTITGTIQTAGATNVFGAHVVAISKTRGVPLVGAISQSNGSYTISNVEPGDYYIFVEPFGISSPLSSLCGGSAANCSYGSVNSNTVCSAGTAPFKRGFIESTAGTAQTFTVNSGAATSTGAYSVSCSAMTGGTVATSIGAADAAGAVISNSSNASAAKTMVIGGLGTNHYFKLSNVSGNISAKVISFSLYSPFNPSVNIVDATDTVVATSTTDNAFTGAATLYTNYDARAAYDNAPSGDYYIRVTNSGPLASTTYPAGNAVAGQIDSTRFYLLVVTVGDSTTLLALPTNNARCEASDSFAAFADHGVPPEMTTASSSSGGGGGGGSSSSSKKSGFGCGTISNFDKNHEHKGPDASALFDIWGLMLVMISIRVMVKLARKRAQ